MDNYKELMKQKSHLRIRIDFSKNLPVTIFANGGKPLKIPLQDIVFSEDLPAITAQIQEIAVKNEGELSANFRVQFEEDTHWYLLACEMRKELMKSPYLLGSLLDISEYIETSLDDPVLRGLYTRSEERMSQLDNGSISLSDVVNLEYLEKIQLPFKLTSGVYSAIYDAQGDLICTPNPKDASFDVSRFPYSKRINIRANHMTVGSWVIASQKEETILANEQLLDMLCLTLSRLANAFILLYNEMSNSERTNKMLSENIEQQILVNSVYHEILENRDTTEIINSVLGIIGNYIKIDKIGIYEEKKDEEMFVEQFSWEAKGKHTDDDGYIPFSTIPTILEQLDFTDYYNPSGFQHELTPYGISHFISLNLNGNGKRFGIVLFCIKDDERLPTEQESRMLRSVTKIISSVLIRYRTDQILERTSERASYLAFHDPILGIPNRAKLDIDLGEELDKNSEGTIAYIKITNLRIFNELFGHSYTDQLLKVVTDYILEMPVQNVSVYRFSGNILTILMKNTVALHAKKFVEALLFRFKSPWRQDMNEHFLEAGVGISGYPQNGNTCEEIYRCSSLAMYRAIEYGVNSYAFYSKEFEKPINADYMYAQKLREAIDKNMQGFFLRYQPTVNLLTGKNGPCEVFVGWHEGEDALSPTKLVQLAENIGFDIQIDRWVIQNACRFCKRMQEQFDPEFSISVNITLRELQSSAIVSMINEALESSGLEGKYLYIEVSERTVASSRDSMIPIISRVKKAGVKLIIDNFGTFNMPPRLMKYSYIDMLKTDLSLFTNVFDEYDEIMLDTVTRLGKLIPEGFCVKRVENKEQYDVLEGFEVSCLQGYFYAKPMEEDELVGFMSKAEETRSTLMSF